MNRRLIRLSFLVLLCLSAIAGAASRSAAQDATPAAGGVTILPPDAVVAGATLGEWSARNWQWLVSFPTGINPGFDETGERCGYGQSGPVFMLPGTFLPEPPESSVCVVPTGVAVFLPLGGAECSTVEPPPFFGRDEAELTACANTMTDPIVVTASIDGEAVADVEQYRTTSPMFTLSFPEDNIFGVPAGSASAVADGYALMLAPLPEGDHEIVASTDFGDGSGPFQTTFLLRVQAPTVIEPVASPEAGTPSAATPTV